MDKDDLKKIYLAKPFEIKNADEYDSDSILDLFINSTDRINEPFAYSNSIIKGKSGSGKTMFLRASYQYFLCILAPALMSGKNIILPIYIRMSDFQNLRNPEQIYFAAIVKIVEEIVGVRKYLESKEALGILNTRAHQLEVDWIKNPEHKEILEKLQKSTAEEYTKSITRNNTAKGKIRAAFLEIYADYNEKVVTEIKHTNRPDITLIDDAYRVLLEPYKGKILILFDGINALDKSFFAASTDSKSYFEMLMDQLLRRNYIRTKIAVYPHSFADILRGSRFGNIVELGLSVVDNCDQYKAFMETTVLLIEKYVKNICNINCKAEDIFEIAEGKQLLIEQLVNASNGNMRRLVHIIDSSMELAYDRNHGEERVTVEDVLKALKIQGKEIEPPLGEWEEADLRKLVWQCCSAKTNKFILPREYTINTRYISESEEENIIQIIGTDSSGNNLKYCFDYAYCVYKDIPTHFKKGTEQVDSTRSGLSGVPIEKVAVIEEYGRSREEKKLGEAAYGNNPSTNDDFKSAVYTNRETIFGAEKEKDFNPIDDDKRIIKNNAGEINEIKLEIKLSGDYKYL